MPPRSASRGRSASRSATKTTSSSSSSSTSSSSSSSFGDPLALDSGSRLNLHALISLVVIFSGVAAVGFSPVLREQLIELSNRSLAHRIGAIAAGIAALAYTIFSLSRLFVSTIGEWRGGGVSGILNHDAMVIGKNQVENSIDSYKDNFGARSRAADGDHDQLLKKRQSNYMDMVNHFYNLVTDFYEYGWGDCFHFGFRFKGEGFMESIRRTEYFLVSRIGLREGMHALDVGCGVGGPMRNIARFTGARITGVNNNEYQIKVGNKHNRTWALDKQCDFLQSDFMNIRVADNTYDCAYAIEATCHAPDKAKCYGEIFRVIKPGGYFAAYDWCVTPKYDANNERHRAIREGIEVGNGLPVLATQQQCIDALVKAGFDVVESFNAQQEAHAGPQHVPWYQSLAGEWSLKGFRMTPLGRFFTHLFVSTLETLRIAPSGSTKVSKLLNDTAIDLVAGGRLEIFTPSFYFLARKPLNGGAAKRK